MSSGQICRNNPVVRDHPLLRGCIHWWLPLPHNSGGRTIFDLIGGNHATFGTETKWGQSHIPGAKGVVHTGGSNGATFSAVALTEYTIVLYGATSGLTYGHYGLGHSATNSPVFGRNNESSLILIASDGTSAQTIPRNKKTSLWGQCAATWVSGSQPIGYQDNQAAGTFTAARGGTATWSYLGWYYNNSWWGGPLSSVMIYDRAMSAEEIYRLYQEQQNVYPTMLHRTTRLSMRVAMFGSGGSPPSFNPAWARAANPSPIISTW